MQHFQSILIAIGAISILLVLLGGLITRRKEKTEKIKKKALAAKKNKIIAAKMKRNSSKHSNNQENTLKKELSQFDSLDLFDDEDDLDLHAQFDQPQHETVKEGGNPNLKSAPLEIDGGIVETEKNAEINELFVFNIVPENDKKLQGYKLLQFFLTAGFKFGDDGCFHRHLHSDGSGAVLFSIENMDSPKTFDIDNMEQFTSAGVAFFIVAPNTEMDLKEAFNMMLTAVEQMTEEFSCIVLDENRVLLTEEKFREDYKRLTKFL